MKPRVCNICGRTNDETPFYRNLNRCRECALQIISTYNKTRNQSDEYKKNRRARWTRWRLNNKDKIRHKPRPLEKKFMSNLASSIKRLHDTDIDTNFLNKLFEKQRGLCAISGLKLEKSRSLFGLKIDMIDNNKGYDKDNIRFICEGINRLKKGNSDEEVKAFIDELKQVIFI